MQAKYAQDTTYHLEQAVKDAQTAAALDPKDRMIKSTLAAWRSELAQQNCKDSKSFKNIFKCGELYTPDEIKSAGSSGVASRSNEIEPNQAGARQRLCRAVLSQNQIRTSDYHLVGGFHLQTQQCLCLLVL